MINKGFIYEFMGIKYVSRGDYEGLSEIILSVITSFMRIQ